MEQNVLKSAKDYGFNEGYLLDKGAAVPMNHTAIGDASDKESLVVPNDILVSEQESFSSSVPAHRMFKGTTQEFAEKYKGAKDLLNGIGIGKIGGDGTIKVGVDFRGDPIYSNAELANDSSPDLAVNAVKELGITLGALGAFSDMQEAGKFMATANRVVDASFNQKLDSLKAANKVGEFVSLLSDESGHADFAAYKAFENWGNLSKSQKALAVAGVGTQGFTLKDGTLLSKKTLTPEIAGAPSLNVKEAIKLAEEDGINVTPATKQWDQLTALQDTLFNGKTAGDVVQTSNSLALLGYGADGAAVPIDDATMTRFDITPAPHYGVGAATIPASNGIPSGYEQIEVPHVGRKVIIPSATRSTANTTAPGVASETSRKIYNTWGKEKGQKITQSKGIRGGSALIGGLSQMATTNPYSLGALMSYDAYKNIGAPAEMSDLGHVTGMGGITLQRLLGGKAAADVDTKGMSLKLDGEFSEDSFNTAMKTLRAEYAKNGLSSSEVGYQLANQAYAEGRLNETQLVGAQQVLNMVFNDNGYVTAQKLLTGKNKGIEILNKRKSSKV